MSHATKYVFVVSTEAGLGTPKLVTLFLFLFDFSQKSYFETSFSKFLKNCTSKFLRVLEYVEKIERKYWKKSFFAKILIFIAESLLYMLLAFFWGIKLFCSSKFEILMLFDLNNLSFYHCHSRASSIKNIPHLGLFLLSMAKWISKYIARDKFWTLWGYFGYFCSLKHLWDKLTHPCLITSFQTLPEIGLTKIGLCLEVQLSLLGVWDLLM